MHLIICSVERPHKPASSLQAIMGHIFAKPLWWLFKSRTTISKVTISSLQATMGHMAHIIAGYNEPHGPHLLQASLLTIPYSHPELPCLYYSIWHYSVEKYYFVWQDVFYFLNEGFRSTLYVWTFTLFTYSLWVFFYVLNVKKDIVIWDIINIISIHIFEILTFWKLQINLYMTR